jgi:predicted DNA-binding protein
MAKIRFTTYVTKDVCEKLKTLSKETRVPQAQYVQEAIEMLLKKYEKPAE